VSLLKTTVCVSSTLLCNIDKVSTHTRHPSFSCCIAYDISILIMENTESLIFDSK